MAKNLIPEIAKMLGVELGENFKIKGDEHTYSIKSDGLHSDQYAMEDDYAILLDLLRGEAEIIKLPWRPQPGGTFYSFGLVYGKWCVCSHPWLNAPDDYGLLEKGWVYRSEEEAQAALPAVAKELGVEYKL